MSFLSRKKWLFRYKGRRRVNEHSFPNWPILVLVSRSRAGKIYLSFGPPDGEDEIQQTTQPPIFTRFGPTQNLPISDPSDLLAAPGRRNRVFGFLVDSIFPREWVFRASDFPARENESEFWIDPTEDSWSSSFMFKPKFSNTSLRFRWQYCVHINICTSVVSS
jgi:hypothetical protein